MVIHWRTYTTLLIVMLSARAATTEPIRVGSKPFNEGYILAEIISQMLEANGFQVERKFGLGGTLICYQALVNAEIDLYPEYSGTIEQAILKLHDRPGIEALRQLLRKQYRLELLPSFGFNNTYALTTRAGLARKLGLRTISDLRRHPELKIGLSYEYLERGDGWRALAGFYGLAGEPVGMEHTLAYPALDAGEIDLMDVYSTDAEISKYDLVLLQDDRRFFPDYLAAPLVRSDLAPRARRVLARLAGSIDEETMQRLNADVIVRGRTFAETADAFLRDKGLKSGARQTAVSRWATLGRRTLTHLQLSGLSLLLALCIALPLGVVAYRIPRISNPVIYSTGLLQTIPSLALLAFMIAPFGTGNKPALIALTLYALLPILRNTATALNSVDPLLKKVSAGMGLTAWQRLWNVELPLAVPTILAGVRTAAVITIGTATLAAFIGAGGLGEYIQTGLALNDPEMILWGAVPAALLAVLTELAFEILERALVPRHLLQGKG